MSRWIIDALWIAAAVLGVILSLMYFRAAQKLYARDKENPPSAGSSGQAPGAAVKQRSVDKGSGPAK